ncbi:MAG TPA: prepilin-type N-terminal cleavage/methylation domain-containing protein [Terriglobales bacterium]|nr:prepilin-type N-terminal cleavage/methylation domain-containing protein [Terriglobales bacterium]
MNLPSVKRQAGFTLLEVLIAMAVTLVIVGAAILALRDSMRTNQDVSYRSDMNDNLRAGLNMIEQDLIQAGTGVPTGGIPIPNTPNSANTCNTTAAPNRPTLTGTLTFPQCNFVLPAVEPGSALGPLITSPDAVAGNPASPSSYTDIITVLYADNSLGLDTNPIYSVNSTGTVICNGSINATGDTVIFDPACANLGTAGVQVQAGDLIMFSNTIGNAIQTVTSVSGQTLKFAAGDPFNLNGRSDPQGTITQIQNSTCNSATPPVCTPNGSYPPTTATRIWMISYYLDNVTDPQHVRLIRRVNFNPGQAVGETLENLQFTYNFIDGVTNPSNQSTVPAGFSENQIRSVDVFLGARSNYSDSLQNRYIRSNLQTQVSLRSMAYRNRYD